MAELETTLISMQLHKWQMENVYGGGDDQQIMCSYTTRNNCYIYIQNIIYLSIDHLRIFLRNILFSFSCLTCNVTTFDLFIIWFCFIQIFIGVTCH